MPQPTNTDPRHGLAGRKPTREFLDTLKANADPGMFGRMFPNLRPLKASDAQLQALANAMKDVNFNNEAGDNPNVPAGFTYLGQFIDHDITLDLTSISEKQEDPFATENFRSPRLDLDSIYGRGPDGSPHLYARDPAHGNQPGAKLLLGKTFDTGEGIFRNDLPRSPEGQALIGDHRNDENLLVAQTHVAFLKFHNKVVDHLAASVAASDLFAEARRTVLWHYQWMVLHDFVERLTEPGIVARILHDGRKFYRFQRWPYMPVEFSAGVYRLGHSMVRQEYSHNRHFAPAGDIAPATLKLEFLFSGLSGEIFGDLAPVPPVKPPTPVPTLPSNWIIDWTRFHELGLPNRTPNFLFNHARRIDPFIVPELHTLPGGSSLPFCNLQRGERLGLPSGQDVAAAMGLPALTPAEIGTGPDGTVAKDQGLDKATPFWYYILKEAEVKGGGQRLGPVGARIMAEVFVGLVAGDKTSYLSAGPSWTPTLPARTPGSFKMVDLLTFVGEFSPIDGI